MSIHTIYTRLVQAGMSPAGACGTMGNMQAESAMRSNNAQDGFSEFSDEVYTAYADRGLIDFVNDSIGYGLCQWTYGPRKRNLLAYARSQGVSIGDEDMQVDFCVKELKEEYPGLWSYLCSCNGVYESASRVCTEYERPAVNNIEERAGYANQFFMVLGGMDVSRVEPEATTPLSPAEAESYWPPRTLDYGMYGPDVVVLQSLLNAHGHSLTLDGQFGNNTLGAVKQFQNAKGLKADGIVGNKTWTKLTER